MTELIKSDILVIGSGIAGLTATLELLEKGFKVVLITKGSLEDCSTNFAQGGIVYKGKEDKEEDAENSW